MCKPMDDSEKEVLAIMNKIDPSFMLAIFGDALANGDCAVLSHVATNYQAAFPEDLRSKVTLIGKIVELVEGSEDGTEAEQKAADEQIAALIKAALPTRPMSALLKKYGVNRAGNPLAGVGF